MNLIQKRIGFLSGAFFVLLVIAGARAAWVGIIRGDSLSKAAATQQAAELRVPAQRGAILDRRGVQLAVAEPADDVSVTPYLIRDPAGAAAKIAPILGLDQGEVFQKIADRTNGFAYLARALPSAKARRLQDLKIPGLTLTPSSRRVYPRQWLASQLLGTVGIDGKGLSGIEYADDPLLKGADGVRRVVRDALGQPIEVRDPQPAKPGAEVKLTIDSAIQDKTEEVLQQTGAKYSPKGATAVVMDPRSGEVLAMANWPRVDANNVGEMPDYAKQNRAVGFNYEPGSTFKAITVAGALEDGKVTPTTSFNLAPQIQVADRTIGEAETRGYETLTTAQILAQSSNVGAITIGQRLGAKEFDRWVRRFGFGKPTGVDLPGEESGQVLPLGEYSGSSMGNLPIGQGVSVTPMQMATAYSAIANGGILRPARVVKAIDARETPLPKGRRVISEKTAAELRDMLKGVFAAGGTAVEASLPGYELAGKTGTANKVDRETGEYSNSKYVASFVGFAPAAKPRLLISVMVDEPNGAIYGGQVAAPAFQKIASFALNYLRIPPE